MHYIIYPLSYASMCAVYIRAYTHIHTYIHTFMHIYICYRLSYTYIPIYIDNGIPPVGRLTTLLQACHELARRTWMRALPGFFFSTFRCFFLRGVVRVWFRVEAFQVSRRCVCMYFCVVRVYASVHVNVYVCIQAWILARDACILLIIHSLTLCSLPSWYILLTLHLAY